MFDTSWKVDFTTRWRSGEPWLPYSEKTPVQIPAGKRTCASFLQLPPNSVSYGLIGIFNLPTCECMALLGVLHLCPVVTEMAPTTL